MDKIKIDLDDVLRKEKVVVELGCGPNKKKGSIGIDRLDLPGVDIIADLENGLPYLPDNSIDEIYSSHVLEHIEDFENLMRDIHRVLKPSGKFHILVPHFSNPYTYSDYTHKKFMGLYTFYYFVDKNEQLKRKVPDFYTDFRFRIVSQTLVFRSPFRIRNQFKKLISKIFNFNHFMQEFYEENFCYIFPCYAIKIIMGPEKKEVKNEYEKAGDR